jgi:type I pantothenate kinase
MTATSRASEGPGSGRESSGPSPFVDLDRVAWAALGENVPLPLTAEELARIRSVGDEVDLAEVREVYLPLSRLLTLHVQESARLYRAYRTFLGAAVSNEARTPFVIGVAGSVSVGKSTTARLLALLLARWPQHPRVELVTTDGFLWPNAELERRGLMARKGFPESYDRRALLRFVTDVKAGRPRVSAPVYSHLTYDIIPNQWQEVDQPDILIVEGVNVLQTAPLPHHGKAVPVVSDFFDFSVYIDAEVSVMRDWYVQRFLTFRDTAFHDPTSYFHRYSLLSDDEAIATATAIWERTNLTNLEENILPTRPRATLILTKGADHLVETVALRRL